MNPCCESSFPAGGGCQSGWYQMDSHCYKSFGNSEPESKSWTDAEADCNDKGGNLAAVYGQNVLCEYEPRFWLTNLIYRLDFFAKDFDYTCANFTSTFLRQVMDE